MARTPFFGRGPGPQIARMDMQSATAPGRAYGKMFESLGESAGQAIETYSKNKQRGEMLDGQIGTILRNMTPEKQKEMESSPLRSDFDKFLAGELTLSKKESFAGSLMLEMKLDEQQKQTEQRDYLWEKQKATDTATNRFFSRLTNRTLHPDIHHMDKKIGEEEWNLRGLRDQPEPPPGRPSNRFSIEASERRLENLMAEREEILNRDPLAVTDPQKFREIFGTLKHPSASWEEESALSGIVAKWTQGLQTRKDSLAGKSFDSLSKRLQVEGTLASRKGDQYVAEYSPPKYYFNKSEASGAILADARAKGITLNKEQLEMAMSAVTVVDTKDLRAQAEKQFREKKVTETISILDAAKDLEAFIEEGGPLSAQVAKEKLARMVQPTGILTEDDLSRMGSSKGMMDRLFTTLEELKTGELDEELKRNLLETTAVFRDLASTELTKRTDQSLDYLSKTFEITPAEASQYTQFGQVLGNLPGVPGLQSDGGSPNPFIPGGVTLPGGGLFTPAPSP